MADRRSSTPDSSSSKPVGDPLKSLVYSSAVVVPASGQDLIKMNNRNLKVEDKKPVGLTNFIIERK